MITVECLKTEEELEEALRLCYRLLAPELMVTLPGGKDGKKEPEQAIGGVREENGNGGGTIPAEVAENIYAYAAWKERMGEFCRLLLCAKEDGELAAAVLGRPESAESLVCGMVACGEKFRRRGITKMLMEHFAKNAREMGFHYITLGADQDAEGFYEKCGFHMIFEIHGQKIYQRMLT